MTIAAITPQNLVVGASGTTIAISFTPKNTLKTDG
jgi:hypothetical protein